MPLLLGIDIGTTHLKVGAYRPDGTLVAMVRRRTPTTFPRSGWAEHPSDELWGGIAESIRKVVSGIPNAGLAVKGIGIAGMAEAGLLVDKAGEPLTPLIAWFDKRAEGYVPAWTEGALGRIISRTTGLVPSHKVPVVKLQWFRDERPGLWDEAWKWLHAPDYVAFCLTGQAATAPSLAGRTMAYDIRQHKWCDWILEKGGIDRDLWPVVRSSVEPVGQLTKRAAAAIGLRPAIPVVIAGHDHLCGAAAVGVLEPGRVLNSMGTAETVITILGEIPEQPDTGAGYNFGCHVVDGTYYTLAGLSRSGGTIDWWLDRLLGGYAPQREEASTAERLETYKNLLDLVQAVPKGPTGVLHLPYLKGSGPPNKDPAATGVLLGLTEDLDTGTWMKAILEGLACEFRRMLEGMDVPSGQPITVIGGGVRNALWLQLKASISRRKLALPPVEEAVLQGAAIAAGVATRSYGSLEEGVAATINSARMLDPDPSCTESYDRWYREVYLVARSTLSKLDQVAREFAGVTKG